MSLLVVDDEAAVREVVAAILQADGFDVVVAANGTDALRCVVDGAPSTPLSVDLSMPGMDGAQTLRAIRKLRPDVPAVLMSGFSSVDHEQIRDLDRVVCLSKPFSRAELIDALANVALNPDRQQELLESLAPRPSAEPERRQP